MTFGSLTYSTVVTLLKVILPLAALGLLSTLFLIARSIEPTTAIPFAKIDLEERARDQRITAPFISGNTSRGDKMSMSASTARPDPDNSDRAYVEKLNARVDLIGGTRVTYSSAAGVIDSAIQQVDLHGGVLVLTSTGYAIRTEALVFGMNELYAKSDTMITANGPPGEFTAGAMILTADEETEDAYLVFTNGVKLVYTPKR